MTEKRFRLTATVSTESPEAIRAVLEALIGDRGMVTVVKSSEIAYGGVGEFRIEAVLAGESAKELNRTLLSALRKAERQTRLRASWAGGGRIEQYFDYVLKKSAAG